MFGLKPNVTESNMNGVIHEVDMELERSVFHHHTEAAKNGFYESNSTTKLHQTTGTHTSNFCSCILVYVVGGCDRSPLVKKKTQVNPGFFPTTRGPIHKKNKCFEKCFENCFEKCFEKCFEHSKK